MLDVAYEERNPDATETLPFLHGSPDGARTWDAVLADPSLANKRAIVPWTRGYGATRFRDGVAPTAQAAASARDAIELLDALGIERCTLVGYGSTGPAHHLSYERVAAYSYRSLFATTRGEAALRDDRDGLDRTLRRMWSPGWSFDEAEFARTARAWTNPDDVAVVLHSYRHRWGIAPGEARYAGDETHLAAISPVTVPAVAIHGADDRVTLPRATEAKEAHFTSRCERLVVPGAGHFVRREAPDTVARAIAGA